MLCLEGFWKSKVMPLITHIELQLTNTHPQEYWEEIRELVRHVNELKQLVDGL